MQPFQDIYASLPSFLTDRANGDLIRSFQPLQPHNLFLSRLLTYPSIPYPWNIMPFTTRRNEAGVRVQGNETSYPGIIQYDDGEGSRDPGKVRGETGNRSTDRNRSREGVATEENSGLHP